MINLQKPSQVLFFSNAGAPVLGLGLGSISSRTPQGLPFDCESAQVQEVPSLLQVPQPEPQKISQSESSSQIIRSTEPKCTFPGPTPPSYPPLQPSSTVPSQSLSKLSSQTSVSATTSP